MTGPFVILKIGSKKHIKVPLSLKMVILRDKISFQNFVYGLTKKRSGFGGK